jgi:F0F1-type ATP synthase assembly protein I
MPREDRNHFLARSVKSSQENANRAGTAAAASYTLVGAIVLLGGIGYALDMWLGSAPWCLMGGLLLGIAVGLYELIRSTWRPR